MDDPWGSPWATNDNPTAPSASPSKTILEPPPPAFLSAPSNLNLPSSQSPWLDDDAFGDWASPDPAQGSNAPPWTCGNELAPIEQLTTSYEPRRKSSTPKWPGSRSASPGLRAPITPNSASPGHLSPDPWANHLPSTTFTKDDPEPIAHLPQIPGVPPPIFENAHLELASDISNQILKDDATDEPSTLEFSDSISEPISKSPKSTDVAAASPPPTSFVQHDKIAPSSGSTTSENDDDEPPDERHADSPITSIEDNPLPKGLKRKSSSKVQELVEMYDGIARRTTVTPERQPAPSRSASQGPDVEADDSPIQDREDVECQDNETAVAQKSSVSAEPITEEPADDRGDVSNDWEEVRRSNRPEHEPFKLDLSKIDDLIPEPTVEVLEDAGEVLDRIITDSFVGITERKMWYRLSRHESLRKYNVGEDENYVRIAWVNSVMRDETMKIVRRWMEEDSMGGRAFRGGFARKAGGKFFGWDSTTESTPVDLDRVFGRKQKRQASIHRPTHSIGALPSLSTFLMVPGSKESTPASAQAKDNWEGLATFGWSSGGGDTKPMQETKPPERTTFAKPLPLGFAGFDNTPKSHASLPAFTTSKPMAPPTPTVNTSTNKAGDDDEVEWGDMVSPTTGEATDSASLPKTSWDSFSTNPFPDSSAVAATSGRPVNPIPDGLGNGNNTTEDNKSGLRDIGASTPAPADVPQSQAGSVQPPASTYTFRPSSTVKRPPNISIAATFGDPPAPSHDGQDGKASVTTGGDTPPTTGLGTPSTAQPRNSSEEDGIVQQMVLGLPDLSYMLK